jgi:hypothetical protein
VTDILAAAGYQVSPPSPGRAAPRGRPGIQVVVTDGVRLTDLERALSDGAGPSTRARVTVSSAEPAPSARTAKPGRSASKKTAGSREVSMTLRALRESVGRTQHEVARRVSMTQPQLSRVETRRDHLLSSLRRYVKALGGDIEIVAVVKGARVLLQQV